MNATRSSVTEERHKFLRTHMTVPIGIEHAKDCLQNMFSYVEIRTYLNRPFELN